MRGLALALALVTIAPAAAAAEPTAFDQARSRFDIGRGMREGGDCNGAVHMFRESLRYQDSIGAHVNIAECVEAASPVVAWRELRAAEKLAADAQLAEIQTHAHALEPKIAMVALTVAPTPAPVSPVASLGAAPPAFEVRLDGELVDASIAGAAFAVEPGPHVVEVRAPGKKPWSHAADGVVGKTARVEVVLEDVPVEPAQASGDRSEMQRTVAIVVGATGAAGLVVGVIGGLLAKSALGDAKATCGPGYPKCATAGTTRDGLVRDENDSVHTRATIANIGFIAGGVLVAAGVGLYLLAPMNASGANVRVGAGGIGGAW